MRQVKHRAPGPAASFGCGTLHAPLTTVQMIVLGGMLVLSIVLAIGSAAAVLAGLFHVIRARVVVLLLALALVPMVQATTPDPADLPIERFLAKENAPHPYRAMRRLEAATGSRKGWLEAATAYSSGTGFQYRITAEGGSGYIRSKLKAVLDGEREFITLGEASRSGLARTNYTFEPRGVDAEGLANVRLSPRRKERALLSGVMFLRPDEGELVRVQGRLAKNPSFWVNNVDIVRKYERIEGAVLPVAVESTANVRFLGPATFQMTYEYSEIDGRAVR
jgi:hypothetical protein